MSVNPEIRRELSDLLGRLRDGQSDAADLARLDAMVSGDPAVCALYQDYVNLFASLHWARVDQAVLRNAAGPRSPEEQKVSCGEEGEAPGWASGSCQSAGVSPDPVSAVVHRLPSSLGGSSALPWCQGSVLLSYLAAALIFGSGSLAAWKWNAADPVRASGLARRCSLTGDGNDGGSNSCRPSDANGRLPTGQRERGAGWRGGRLGPEVFVGLRRWKSLMPADRRSRSKALPRSRWTRRPAASSTSAG